MSNPRRDPARGYAFFVLVPTLLILILKYLFGANEIRSSIGNGRVADEAKSRAEVIAARDRRDAFYNAGSVP